MKEDNNISYALLGARYGKIRKQLGYTQKQMADYLGVNRTLIVKFEKGERSLGLSALERSCKLFGCTLAEIDGRNDDYRPLSVSCRAKSLQPEDMEAIAAVQNIVLNLRKVKRIGD